jgi:hypothetical protein
MTKPERFMPKSTQTAYVTKVGKVFHSTPDCAALLMGQRNSQMRGGWTPRRVEETTVASAIPGGSSGRRRPCSRCW